MNLNQLAAVIEHAQQLENQNQILAAIALYQEWIDDSENGGRNLLHAAYFNMGCLLRQAGQLPQAIEAFHKALEIKKDLYQASVNLGLAFEASGDNKNALEAWNQALQLDEAQILLLNHQGRVHENEHQYDQAERMLKRSLLLNPNQPGVIQHYLHIRQKMCKWPILEPVAGISEQHLLDNCGPLGILAFTDNPALQQQVISSWVERRVPRNQSRLSPLEGYKHDKIRLAYLSCDFRWHAVSILTAELFELHDREHFEIYAIDYSHDDNSALRNRVLQAMDQHVPIHALSDQEAAQAIRGHEIDILIDLTGLTSSARPGILAYKPAPIQISYLGFVGTMGMPEIDYILADRFVFPESLIPHFTEKPLYLPEVYQANDSQRPIDETPSRASCGLPEDAFVYCSFNGSYKISPEVFLVWMNILSRVPNSVLWLVADNDMAKKHLHEEASKHGVNPKRLIFAEKVPPSQYLARYRAADLLLDTSPYNAGTTASDALWADLPVLTCPGNTFASRMAGSLLTAVGLSELIMPNWQAYEERAILLGQHPELVAGYKNILQAHKLETPLFDSKRFARNLERVLSDLHNRHTCHQRPQNNHPLVEIVSATLKTEEEFWQHSPLGLSLKRLQGEHRLLAHVTFQNQQSLAEIYNERIQADSAADILVFMHDDVWIDDYYLVDRLLDGIQDFDVIGVVGNKNRKPFQPSWAFIQVNNGLIVDDFKNFSGSIAHGAEPNGKLDIYGKTPAACELLDGVFLAVSKNTLRESGLLFDTLFDFHFYDLDFCRRATQLGLKVGTWPICLTHQSGGAFGTADWEKGRRNYFGKWGS